ncbi:hypothetical protein AC249_AIPGENE1110 [Exaiptasia diaphana]|nr:hypothetical protein AC249_AIPGENE1110 [Exaiptasia diaphana]
MPDIRKEIVHARNNEHSGVARQVAEKIAECNREPNRDQRLSLIHAHHAHSLETPPSQPTLLCGIPVLRHQFFSVMILNTGRPKREQSPFPLEEAAKEARLVPTIQARWVTRVLKGLVKLPSPNEMWKDILKNRMLIKESLNIKHTKPCTGGTNLC